MQYYITIQDVDNMEDELIVHYSGKDDVSLRWLGGDDKTQTIIGSELTFSILVDDCEEGKYDKYFTSDEQKWLVKLWIEESDADDVVWQGFLLPESYSEPYANNTFLVNFSAVDGLGLLKGKELPDKYYEQELRATEYINAALKLTGVGFDWLLSPAIVNKNKKSWSNVIIDGRWFVNEQDERMSAYDILEDIIFSMRCQLFQDRKESKGWWRVDGISKRQLVSVEYEIYEINGSGVPNGTVTFDKNVKELDWVSYPDITLIPPFKKVVSTHDKEDSSLPESLYINREGDFDLDGYQIPKYDTFVPQWDNEGLVVDYWIPEGWQYDDYHPIFYYNEDNLYFENEQQNDDFNPDRKFEIREKPYVLSGQRLKLNISFRLKISPYDFIPSDSDIEDWINAIVYRVSVGDDVIFYNLGATLKSPESLKFNRTGEAEAELIFTVQNNGFFNVEIFEPFGDISDTHFEGAYLTDISLENADGVDDDDDYSYTVEIQENASKSQELDIPISQDITGLTPNFQLDYLRNYEAGTGSAYVGFIHNIFSNEGKKYYVVDIQTAKLINQFPNNTYYRFGTSNDNHSFTDVEVIMNYEGGDEFVVTGIQENPSDTPQQFVIYALKNRLPQITQDKWIEWSNAFYGVESKPYLQVVSELERELYEVPMIKMEGDCKNPVKINDIIRFRYKGDWRYLMVSDCEWNIGNNVSTVILQEAMYNGSSLGLIPPYVFAGEDMTVANPGIVVGDTGAYAYAINGTIETYLWEQIEGATATIENPDQLMPNIHNIQGNGNVFRLTVTDSNGNTASDEIEINTSTSVSVVFSGAEGDVVVIEETTFTRVIRSDQFVPPNPMAPLFFTMDIPGLPEEALIKLKVRFEWEVGAGEMIEYGNFMVTKNGFSEYYFLPQEDLIGLRSSDFVLEDLYFRGGDTVTIKLNINLITGQQAWLTWPISEAKMYGKMIVYDYEVINGYITIDNLNAECGLEVIPER